MLVDAHAAINDSTMPNIALQHPDASRTRLLLGGIDADKDYVHVTIQDNGGGVPREVMERIFDPFFTTKDSESGTGLGMSIIHGIVSDLGGAMAIDSIQNTGTCIDIFLPACAPPLQDKAVESGPGGDEALADYLEGEIVVIDDDENVRIMMGHMLERRNIRVTSFVNARDGLAYIQAHAHRVDCVITDHNMPDLTGLDMVETLEEEYPKLPFVIVTGYNTEHLTHAMREYPGLRAIVHKPITTQELMAAIQRAVITEPEEDYY
jgi:CheY-like chemotaxis protein